MYMNILGDIYIFKVQFLLKESNRADSDQVSFLALAFTIRNNFGNRVHDFHANLILNLGPYDVTTICFVQMRIVFEIDKEFRVSTVWNLCLCDENSQTFEKLKVERRTSQCPTDNVPLLFDIASSLEASFTLKLGKGFFTSFP